jgi:Fe-S-cluster containining protein
MEPIEFLDLIPDYQDREREEPAILIDGKYSILVLKRDENNVCCFYSGSGCRIYESRPMLCRTYPFKIKTRDTELSELLSRDCPKKWIPLGEEKEQYLADCKEYLEQLEEYKKLAKEWNELGGGSFEDFLEFIQREKE